MKDLGLNVKIVDLKLPAIQSRQYEHSGLQPRNGFPYAGPGSLNSPANSRAYDFNYASNHGSIYTWWSDPQFDAMADKARGILDTQARNAQLKSAFEYAAQQAPMVWTLLIDAVAFREKAIKSIKQRPGGNLVRIEDWRPA